MARRPTAADLQAAWQDWERRLRLNRRAERALTLRAEGWSRQAVLAWYQHDPSAEALVDAYREDVSREHHHLRGFVDEHGRVHYLGQSRESRRKRGDRPRRWRRWLPG